MIVAGVTLAISVGFAGVAETRPLSASAAERLGSMVAEPEQHQTCRSSSGVEVCGFTDYGDYLDRVLANVSPVAAAVPGRANSVLFRQVFDGDLDALGPEVSAALDGRSTPVDGFLPLGYLNTDEAMNVARITLALDAVGLPVRTRLSGAPTVIAGEARGVVAVWLAARGLDPGNALDLASHHFDPDHQSGEVTPRRSTSAWPGPTRAPAAIRLPSHGRPRILRPHGRCSASRGPGRRVADGEFGVRHRPGDHDRRAARSRRARPGWTSRPHRRHAGHLRVVMSRSTLALQPVVLAASVRTIPRPVVGIACVAALPTLVIAAEVAKTSPVH